MKIQIKNFITPLHQQTSRDYLARMNDDKVYCMKVAKEYESDYWDGDRRYGYGGYRYIEGRWSPVAQQLIDDYQLTSDSKILDVGCGKAYLLHEIKQLLPGAEIVGFDISNHGISDAQDSVKSDLKIHKAEEPYPYNNDYFDLVISLGCLHNLRLYDLKPAVKEIERVGQNKYIMVESYRNETELFNLQCWALTAEAFHTPDEWLWLYQQFNYTGDYEFIYFE